MKLALTVMVISLTIAGAVLAHSGGTDQYGCHYDHIHGGYHCH